MKPTLFVLAATAFLATAAYSQNPDHPKQNSTKSSSDRDDSQFKTLPVRRIKDSTALIQGKHSQGSGFLVAPGLIATNAHVIALEMPEDIRVRFIGDNGQQEVVDSVNLIFEDTARDLAFLRLRSPRAALTLSVDFEPKNREPIYVIGNPAQPAEFAAVNVVARGIYDGVVIAQGQSFVRIKTFNQKSIEALRDALATGSTDKIVEIARENAINVGKGNSGCPVVDDSGNVIGVLTRCLFHHGGPVGTHFCVPARDLKSAIDNLGPASGWQERIRGETDRHAFDLALICTHARMKMVEATIEARDRNLGRAPYSRAPALIRNDVDLIKFMKDTDNRLVKMSQAACRAARGSPTISQKLKNQLDSLQANVAYSKQLAQNASVSHSAYKQIQLRLKDHEERMKKLLVQVKISEVLLGEMTDSILPTSN